MSSYEAYRYSLELVFVRAKYLFLSILNAVEIKNEYAGYTLLKTYWETVALFGYLVIGIENFQLNEPKMDDKILRWLYKNVRCGKHFPPIDEIKRLGLKEEDARQVNVLTMLEKVNKDITKRYKNQGETSISSFYEVYLTYLAELGHPTYLGLSICIENPHANHFLANPNKSYNKKFDEDLLIFLRGATHIFFNYWTYSSVKH